MAIENSISKTWKLREINTWDGLKSELQCRILALLILASITVWCESNNNLSEEEPLEEVSVEMVWNDSIKLCKTLKLSEILRLIVLYDKWVDVQYFEHQFRINEDYIISKLPSNKEAQKFFWKKQANYYVALDKFVTSLKIQIINSWALPQKDELTEYKKRFASLREEDITTIFEIIESAWENWSLSEGVLICDAICAKFWQIFYSKFRKVQS